MTDLQGSNRRGGIYPLPTFVSLIAVVLVLSFTVLLVSMLAGFHAGAALLHTNPFAAYEALWPGLPATNVETYTHQTPEGFIRCITSRAALGGYETSPIFDTPVQQAACMSAPKDGVFQAVNVFVNRGRIRQLNLFSNALQEEALFLYWGAPDAIQTTDNRLLLELQWDRQTYSASALVGKADAVVTRVTLTAKADVSALQLPLDLK